MRIVINQSMKYPGCFLAELVNDDYRTNIVMSEDEITRHREPKLLTALLISRINEAFKTMEKDNLK